MIIVEERIVRLIIQCGPHYHCERDWQLHINLMFNASLFEFDCYFSSGVEWGGLYENWRIALTRSRNVTKRHAWINTPIYFFLGGWGVNTSHVFDVLWLFHPPLPWHGMACHSNKSMYNECLIESSITLPHTLILLSDPLLDDSVSNKHKLNLRVRYWT